MSNGGKYYQGKFIPKNPQKYAGDPTGIIYRSSWELRFFNWLDSNESVETWSSEELVIPYLCPTDNKVHRYFPDVKVKIRNKDGVLTTYLIEIKPEVQCKPPTPPKRKTKRYLQEVLTWGKNEAKWKAADSYARDRGWKFMVFNEKHLGIK